MSCSFFYVSYNIIGTYKTSICAAIAYLDKKGIVNYDGRSVVAAAFLSETR